MVPRLVHLDHEPSCAISTGERLDLEAKLFCNGLKGIRDGFRRGLLTIQRSDSSRHRLALRDLGLRFAVLGLICGHDCLCSPVGKVKGNELVVQLLHERGKLLALRQLEVFHVLFHERVELSLRLIWRRLFVAFSVGRRIEDNDVLRSCLRQFV